MRPLFPCYLFASLNLATGYHFISRTPGVVGIICVGDEPSEIADSVIQEIKSRAPNGIVDVTQQNFRAGDAVHVAQGALRGISAVFEQYLSGSERAALLLEFMGAGNVRAVLPSKLLMREDKDHF
jgi:transcription antitermination factor NusG